MCAARASVVSCSGLTAAAAGPLKQSLSKLMAASNSAALQTCGRSAAYCKLDSSCAGEKCNNVRMYQMLYGRPPFHHITKPLPKMQAIIDAKVVIEFPSLKEKWEKSGHRCATAPAFHVLAAARDVQPQHQRQGDGGVPGGHAGHPATRPQQTARHEISAAGAAALFPSRAFTDLRSAARLSGRGVVEGSVRREQPACHHQVDHAGDVPSIPRRFFRRVFSSKLSRRWHTPAPT